MRLIYMLITLSRGRFEGGDVRTFSQQASEDRREGEQENRGDYVRGRKRRGGRRPGMALSEFERGLLSAVSQRQPPPPTEDEK